MSHFFSLIVPAYNEEAMIGTTLSRILESVQSLQTHAQKSAEVVVVDDVSTDLTKEIASGFNCRVVMGEHQGIGAARNCGARASDGKYLVFVDADTAVPPDLLTRILKAIEDGILAGPVNPVYQPIYWWHRPYFSAWRIYARRHNMAQGVCQLFERDLFFHLGGYDERLQHAEDTDLHWRTIAHQNSVGQPTTVSAIPGVAVYPSMRRYEQSTFWWTVMKLNPVRTKLNLKSRRAWKEWYDNPPR